MNSGKIIKILAVIFSVVLLLVLAISLIATVESYTYYDYLGNKHRQIPAQIWIIFFIGTISVACFGLMFYGFGALVDSNISMNRKMDTLINNTRQPQAPRYDAPAPQSIYTPQPSYAPPAPAAPIIDEPTMVFPVLDNVQQPPLAETPVPQEPSGWVCGNCGTPSPAMTAFCRNCGHPRA